MLKKFCKKKFAWARQLAASPPRRGPGAEGRGSGAASRCRRGSGGVGERRCSRPSALPPPLVEPAAAPLPSIRSAAATRGARRRAAPLRPLRRRRSRFPAIAARGPRHHTASLGWGEAKLPSRDSQIQRESEEREKKREGRGREWVGPRASMEWVKIDRNFWKSRRLQFQHKGFACLACALACLPPSLELYQYHTALPPGAPLSYTASPIRATPSVPNYKSFKEF